MASQSSGKACVGIAEQVDDVVVEDLRDCQLLSVLKAIGIEDANSASKGPERSVPVKVNPGKQENDIQEKIQQPREHWWRWLWWRSKDSRAWKKMKQNSQSGENLIQSRTKILNSVRLRTNNSIKYNGCLLCAYSLCLF